MKLFINPGHAPRGRPDPGAVAADGTQEAILVRDIAEVVAKRWRNQGMTVLVEQSDDLNEVIRLANEEAADYFISIHANATTNPQVFGAEVYVHHDACPQARALAEKIAEEAHIAHWPVRSSATHGYREANFQVLRETHMPAVLLEVGFLSNRQELERLQKYGTTQWPDILAKVFR